MKKKTSDKNLIVNPSNPWDYLTRLKETGKTIAHDNLENIGKSAASLITSMNVDSEINIANSVHELLNSKIIVPKDMKVDDGDLPLAANFYEWVTQDRFGTIGDERPFLEQLIWGLITFNDICRRPECSDWEWILHDRKVDDTYTKLERKVSILHHGVCPRCGMGRSESVRLHNAPYINELAVNAGQRCVVGGTPVITQHGLLHIDEVYPDAPLGFTKFNIGVHNSKELETTSHFFRAAPEPVIRLDTVMGFSVTGTHDHPIYLDSATEFVKLSQVVVGDTLSIHYGQRVFGNRSFANAYHYGATFQNTVLPIGIRIAGESDQIAFLQGIFKESRRVIMGMSALRDISALLLNAGYPHIIDGPCIQLTDEVFQNLKTDTWSSGKLSDSIASAMDVGLQETFDFTLPETHQFITGGILSHNSGKSHTVGTYLFPYLMHRLLKLQKPAQFYGLSRTTVLQGTFAALTYTQAKDTLWTPFYGALLESSWFKSYHSMLKHYENVYGEKLFKLTDTFVDYRVRGLQCYPVGPDARILRGRTRFGFGLDEIAFFDSDKDSKKVKISAFGVYDALANSLATVRTAADTLINRGYDDVLPAYAMNVSSPVAKNDMIHTLLNRAKESNSIHGVTRPTWEVNPNFKRNSRFIVEAYRKDPESAEKNFGANPPMISNPFIANHKMIMACEDTTRKNAIKIKPVYRNSKKAGQSYMYGEIDKIKKSGKPSILCIDAGVTDNSFSLAGGTLDDDFNLCVDLIGEVIPMPGFRINFSHMYENIIVPIMEKRNVKVLLADRWNSLTFLDDARLHMGDPDADIPTFIAAQHSLKYVEMVGVRTRMEQGTVFLPKSEISVPKLLEASDAEYRDFYQGKPVAHLFKQLFTIKDLEKGVGKGDGYTDDNWRALALLLWGLQEEEYMALLMSTPIDMQVARPSAIGASRLGSGAGSSVGVANGGVTTRNGAPLMIMGQGRR